MSPGNAGIFVRRKKTRGVSNFIGAIIHAVVLERIHGTFKWCVGSVSREILFVHSPSSAPAIRTRWKQSKRFNFGRRCNITVPSEIETRNPYVASPRRCPVLVHGHHGPFLIVWEANDDGHDHEAAMRCHPMPLSRIAHTLRMNFASVRSSFCGTSAPSY